VFVVRQVVFKPFYRWCFQEFSPTYQGMFFLILHNTPPYAENFSKVLEQVINQVPVERLENGLTPNKHLL